jgi:hypothetical protein
MRIRAELLGVLALAGVAACQEPPSYRLRWAIDGREMLDVSACSESGMLEVRARAYTAPGTFTDERTYPCFSTALAEPEGTVGGSALPPGRYAIELRGIDRTGDAWDAEEVASLEPDAPEHTGCSPDGDVVECRPNELVCDCQRLVVVAAGSSASEADATHATVVEEGATAALPEFVLVPPPQCIDGIDNDRDGLVDVGDPSCNVDFGDGSEGVPVGVTELRLELSLLDDNPAVSCASVPLRRLRLGYVSGDGGEGDATEVVLEEPCDLEAPYLASLRLPAGMAVFSAVGLDSGGEPVTVAKVFEATISPIGGTVQQSIDFGPEDFLEPIVRELRAAPGYVSELGRQAKLRYSCAPPSLVPGEPATRGTLTIAGLRVHVLNGHGGPLDTPATLDDGMVLDGQNVIECTSSVVTAPLEWGGFTMAIEALSAEGEVCFSNLGAPVLMSPGGVSGLFLPRVYGTDGTVPASCHDCETDAECGLEGELFCVDNVCQGRCTSDAECLSDELGDLGFVCVDGRCDRG